MKIRIGFVSNSSSSNFVIIGSAITWSDTMNRAVDLIIAERLYAEAGEDYGEGRNFFPITQKMWQAYIKYGAKNPMQFYDVQHKVYEGGKVKKKDIKGSEFEIFSMEVSNHSCKTLEEFKEQCLSVPEDPVPENIVKKAQRARKLQAEIEKDGYKMKDIPK